MRAAPLPAPGSLVWIRQRRWRVERARRWRHVVRLDVTSARRAMTFLAPFDAPAQRRWRQRPVRARRQEGVARVAGVLAGAHRLRDLPAAIPADIRLWPYQLEPALALLDGYRRVLLADEVGLGKTVQAALAIAEVLRREPGARMLVVTPASVREQWRDELRRRVAVDARIADQARLNASSRELAYGESPWRQAGVWLVSTDFVKQPHVLEALPEEPLDLLVIDEAHDTTGESERYAACRAIAGRARRLLLLTATPHSGDATRFDRLLAMGALDYEPRQPLVFRRTRRELGIAGRRRIRWRAIEPSPTGRSLLDALLAYEARVLAASQARRREDAALLLLAVLRKRALSTALAFRRSVERRLALLGATRGAPAPDWLQPGLDFAGDVDDLDAGDLRALAADVGLAAGHERSWLRRLLQLAVAAERNDRRPAWIASLLGRTREPAIVFTEFRDSLDAVARALNGLRTTALLHGGLGAAERGAALDRFQHGEAGVLIATDVASQGLNLQHRCRWVINLELPWNPIRLEQRAGRVDRVGQTRPVRVTMVQSTHAAEHDLLAKLAKRVFAARDSIGADALPASLPDDESVRRAIVGPHRRARDADDALPCPDAPEAAAAPTVRLRLSRRWRRPAARLARDLERRRWLAAHWRGRQPPGGRPRRIGTSADPAAETARPGVLIVCSASLVDGRGLVVERHVLAFRSGCPPGAPTRARLTADLARATAARLAPRVRRLEHALGRSARARVALERALWRATTGGAAAALVQSGLFDRRADVAASVAAADAARVEDDARAHIEDARRSARVTMGPVRVELIAAPEGS